MDWSKTYTSVIHLERSITDFFSMENIFVMIFSIKIEKWYILQIFPTTKKGFELRKTIKVS